jgi:hypothetical protein
VNEPRRTHGGGKNRRRKQGGNAVKAPRQVDLWQPVPALPDPVPIEPAVDPRVLVRSLGDAPLSGQGAVAEHYMGAVVDRAAGLAAALAAAAGLLAEAAEE